MVLAWRGNSSMRMSAVIAMLWLAAVSVQAIEDHVTKVKNNEQVSGRVKKADLTGVEIEIKDPKTQQLATVTLASAEIQDIDWDVNDQDFRQGMAAYDGGGFVLAAQRFQGIVNDPESLQAIRGEVRPALYFYLAESLYRSGKPNDAVPMFEKLMTDFKTSYYVPLAVGSVVDAAIQTNNLAKVPPLLAQLRALGGEQKPLADYYEGQMLLAQGKVKDADTRFAGAVSSSNVPSTKGMALMGQAKCAIAEKNLTKGRDLAQKALAAGPPPNVAGAAHLIIGDALLAEVEAQKPAGDVLQNKLMDALLSYMRVLEQYRGVVDTEAQAMLHAGDCLQRLSRLPNRGADKHRAVYMYTQLMSEGRYRTTRYAAEAAEAMKTVK
jgi:TolA-binding protein